MVRIPFLHPPSVLVVARGFGREVQIGRLVGFVVIVPPCSHNTAMCVCV